MSGHAAREHATWSASATARNWHCPGALALSANAPKQRESEHAARGTACHQVAETALRTGEDVASFLGTVEHGVTIDEELVQSAAVYVVYVREQELRWAWVHIEQRFSLDALKPPFEAGGTADAVLYYPGEKLLEVVDLKNGMGVVDVLDNPQLRTYALGALLANPGLDVEQVKVTIVQPRAPHPDGRIRSDTFHVSDLLDWTRDLLDAMHAASEAIVQREWMSEKQWALAYLQPGRCKFCPAEGFCPALQNKALETAAVWFDDGTPKRAPDELPVTPERMAEILDALDLVEDWSKAVRSLAHTMAEAGSPPTGYVLVEKHGRRAWAAEENKIRSDLMLVAGLAEDEIWVEPKLRSPAQVEKLLGAKRKHLIASMWSTPVTGTNLVRADKTDRPAIGGTAARYFEPET